MGDDLDIIYSADEDEDPHQEFMWGDNHDDCSTFANALPDEPPISVSQPEGVFRAEFGKFGLFMLMALLLIVLRIRRRRLQQTFAASRSEYHVVNTTASKLVEKSASPIQEQCSADIENALGSDFCSANGLEGYSGHEGTL